MTAWPAAAAASLLIAVLSCCEAAQAIRTHGGGAGAYVSALGDPGMRRDGLRVAWEAWNFCNEVGQEAPGMGSPRGADCFDLETSVGEDGQPVYEVVHRVSDAENNLRAGDPFPGAAENGRPARPFAQTSRFPCPGGAGCMNQPLVFHNRTALDAGSRWLRGGVFGTYELDAADDRLGLGSGGDVSYYSVTWEKEVASTNGWVFHHKLRTSKKVPESPDFKVRVTLEVKQGGGPNSQFYLMDMGSCWKNNGKPCDGDTATDVTRYSEMIINPDTPAWCKPSRIDPCPPWHTFRNGTRVHRSDAARFPYAAYHVYCSPGNARRAEQPTTYCDAYSNPQTQEILQLVPHPVWGEFGYPTAKGQGWIGDPRAWELDVGALSQALYFYQDPGTTPARRRWTSLDVGTEIYVSENAEAEWTLSGFDILVPDTCAKSGQGTSNSCCW
ncbi:hypothetical protein HU200_052640 [Digitaria exilis]|uniref:DUF7705 domain-containing protein n=1 Tax=Digitaria exilis TaxID=1010633 RepID=A0A835ATL7_9POAL|nr:hypothetical protein HU200_052640 [Digitaria exilis]